MTQMAQRFTGAEEWARAVHSICPTYQRAAADLYSRAADYMVDTAQSLCPVEVDAPFRRAPGTLRNSIRKEITSNSPFMGYEGESSAQITMVIEGSEEAYYAT